MIDINDSSPAHATTTASAMAPPGEDPNNRNAAADGPTTPAPPPRVEPPTQSGQTNKPAQQDGPSLRRKPASTGSNGARDAYDAFSCSRAPREPSTSSRTLSRLMNPFEKEKRAPLSTSTSTPPPGGNDSSGNGRGRKEWSLARIRNGIITFGQFVGPGFMIAVAYSEPLHCLSSHHQMTDFRYS